MTIERRKPGARCQKRWQRRTPDERDSSTAPGSAKIDANADDLVDSDQPKHRKSARTKIMDYLARREHSEFELRQKLSRDHSPEDVEAALQFARESGWMTKENELAERVSEELSRKNKGHLYIQQFLNARGLPSVDQNLDEEVRKAQAIVTSKLAKEGPFDYEEQRKIYRLLVNRGFDDETIRRVIESN